jgi:hypothetical protein
MLHNYNLAVQLNRKMGSTSGSPAIRSQELFIAQTAVLQMTGFISYWNDSSNYSLSCKQKIISAIMNSIAILLLCGTGYFGCLKSALFIYNFLYSTSANDSDQNESGLLFALRELPFRAISTRCFFVLSVAFIKRQSLMNLISDASDLILLSLPDEKARQLFLLRIKLMSVVILGVTFAGHILWEYLEWVYFFGGWSSSALFAKEIALLPHTSYLSKMYTWQYLIIYCIFNILPFVLSQQIFLCAILLAVVLSDVLQALREEIDCQRAAYGSLQTTRDRKNKYELTARKLTKWETIHHGALVLVENINHYFRSIFLVTYLLDLLTMLGFASRMSAEVVSFTDYLFSIGSVFLFGFYMTVLPVPLVRVYEKVKEIIFSVTSRAREPCNHVTM